MRTIPKEVGNLAIDTQRSITLSNAKGKWVTGTIELCIKDFLRIMVPREQKGCMPGTNTDGDLHKVMEIHSKNEQGARVSIDLLKAYDKVGHPIIEGVLRYVGLGEHWIRMLIEFVKEGLGFLVANKVSDTWIQTKGEIRQGDSLSPAMYAMITAVLCVMLQKALPVATRLLYADDTLLWIPGIFRKLSNN